MKSRNLLGSDTHRGQGTSNINDGQVKQPLLLTIAQVGQQLGLSETTIYRLIATKEIPIVKIGRSTRVMYIALLHG